MAVTYEVVLAIRVGKTDEEERVVTEDHYFPKLSFAEMANVADNFYELVEKLRKKK